MALASLPLEVFVLMDLDLWTCPYDLPYLTRVAMDAIGERITPSGLAWHDGLYPNFGRVWALLTLDLLFMALSDLVPWSGNLGRVASALALGP